MVDYRQYYDDDTFLKRVGLVEKRQKYDYRRWLFRLYGLPIRGRWLDLGCGDGRDIEWFVPHVSEAVGVDFSDVNLMAAQKRLRWHRNVRLQLAEAGSFESEKKFALVSCNFSFYYFDSEEIVKKMRRWVGGPAPGAVFIAGSPDENNVEFNALVTTFLFRVPEVYKPGFSDVRKYEGLFRKYFDDVQFYRLINPVVFESNEEFGEYIRSTTVWQSLEEAERADFYDKCMRLLRTRGEPPVLTKIVDVLRAS